MSLIYTIGGGNGSSPYYGPSNAGRSYSSAADRDGGPASSRPRILTPTASATQTGDTQVEDGTAVVLNAFAFAGGVGLLAIEGAGLSVFALVNGVAAAGFRLGAFIVSATQGAAAAKQYEAYGSVFDLAGAGAYFFYKTAGYSEDDALEAANYASIVGVLKGIATSKAAYGEIVRLIKSPARARALVKPGAKLVAGALDGLKGLGGVIVDPDANENGGPRSISEIRRRTTEGPTYRLP